jgi:hypothetical protein
MTMGRRRGRPRSTTWIGKLGEFVSEFTPELIAGELDLDTSPIYHWARGDGRPKIEHAIAMVELARAAGRDLSLEDIYQTEVTRVRVRMRSLSSP